MARQIKNRKRFFKESDGTYLLKLVMCVILGSFWVRFGQPMNLGPIILSAIPVGLFIGLFLVSRDRFPINRKIGYALLVMMTIITAFSPTGIVI